MLFSSEIFSLQTIIAFKLSLKTQVVKSFHSQAQSTQSIFLCQKIFKSSAIFIFFSRTN